MPWLCGEHLRMRTAFFILLIFSSLCQIAGDWTRKDIPDTTALWYVHIIASSLCVCGMFAYTCGVLATCVTYMHTHPRTHTFAPTHIASHIYMREHAFMQCTVNIRKYSIFCSLGAVWFGLCPRVSRVFQRA